ncbi:MAG: biliverdin-producing heme oxygenase [Myxococcota bacterium]|nr:biliverdin-producing heme oxygenase [Myxococcota bacterium]
MSNSTSIASIPVQGGLSRIRRIPVQPTTGRVDIPVSTSVDPASLAFSKRIRAGTAQSHRLTESTSFVKGILRGAVDLESYRNMQIGLYSIYSAMEEELERHRTDPLVRSVYFEQLPRRAALEQDLRFLFGPLWREQIHLTPARKQYLDRIRWVSRNDPGLLVAHSYTRYLGDLSGGRVVEKIVRRSLRMDGEDGFRFFHFDGIGDMGQFKNIYRSRLDGLPISVARGEEIIDESRRVFALNRQIFEELEGSWLRTLAKMVPLGFSRKQAV